MMVLYSGTTCPFSQRCRLVLFEKGMDFEVRDVDLFNKPEDISTMNPYGQVPILVERELILYESNIINEYIDERFPHPQLMPADPLMRARARRFGARNDRQIRRHHAEPDLGVLRVHIGGHHLADLLAGEQQVRFDLLLAQAQVLEAVVAHRRGIVAVQAIVDQQLGAVLQGCLLYTSPSPRDGLLSRMPSSA